MPATPRKTHDVLASARKDLKAQLARVRAELGRLAAEERALTEAVSSLNGGSGPSATAGAGEASNRRPRRKAGTGRRRRARAATKSTADRVKELQGVLADGPKSRNDLAAALKVSPARVQQLLAELGRSVSSEAAPGRQGKLWSLKESGNGASSARPKAKPRSGAAKGTPARKPAARKPAARKTVAAK